MLPHLVYILFLFALGASVGSFLNVVVWRLPRIELDEKDGLWREITRTIEGLSSPPSHCPKCEHKLAWRDNIPVFGWIFLRGRCRYCGAPISSRYPIVEFVCGALFVGYYVAFFIFHIGPCAAVGNSPLVLSYWHDGPTTLVQQWPVYFLTVFMVAMLLAISLIDAELLIIPTMMPWLMALVGFAVHALIDTPRLPGAINVGFGGISGALGAGGAIGLVVSIVLFHRGIIKASFVDGEPGLEIDEEMFAQEVKRARKEGREPPERPKIRTYSKREIRGEIGHEIAFLLPPMMGALGAALLVRYVPSIGVWWGGLMEYHWLTGLLGAILGALAGAFLIWLARILGTLALGRIAMGLGDVHLMFGVGAIIGAGPSVVAFFLAPFAGMVVGIYQLFSRKKHELPYGPYLSLAAAVTVIAYCPIADAFAPGMQGIAVAIRSMMGG